MDALQFIQCTRHIQNIHDFYLFNMVEDSVKIFMDNFSMVDDSFDDCMPYLVLVLRGCKEKNLGLNSEKCLFMVKEGIVLGDKIFWEGD